MLDVRDLQSSFEKRFGKAPRVFSAPGRVNLIGEHTDYNDGFVLPVASQLRTYVAAAARDDQVINVHSSNFNEDATFTIGDQALIENSWVRYVQGMVNLLSRNGSKLKGADLSISSEVPIGAGLSSSAALEIAVGYAVLKISQADVDLMELATVGQKAEHEFVGTKSGLMDQLTATFAEKGHALFIDCRSLELKPIAVNVPSAAIIVCDTKTSHELSTSKYNERRQECETGVALLSERVPGITSLRDVGLEEFRQHEELLPDAIRRRCRHVITENDRTQKAVDALRDGDAELMGKLINLSHESLRDDFEVSSHELNLMVEAATRLEFVYGARMMGGGFGGSTVNLIRRDSLEQFEAEVRSQYQAETGLDPGIIVIDPDQGVFEVTN